MATVGVRLLFFLRNWSWSYLDTLSLSWWGRDGEGIRGKQWLHLRSGRWQGVGEVVGSSSDLLVSPLLFQIHEVGKKTENEHLMCWAYPPLLSLLAWIKFVCYEQRFFLYTVLWKSHSGFDIQTKKTILLSVKHSVDQCLKKFLGGTSVFSNRSKLFIKKYFCGLISLEIAN